MPKYEACLRRESVGVTATIIIEAESREAAIQKVHALDKDEIAWEIEEPFGDFLVEDVSRVDDTPKLAGLSDWLPERDKIEIVIEVRGGVVQEVRSSSPDVNVTLLDFDEEENGGTVPDAPASATHILL